MRSACGGFASNATRRRCNQGHEKGGRAIDRLFHALLRQARSLQTRTNALYARILLPQTCPLRLILWVVKMFSSVSVSRIHCASSVSPVTGHFLDASSSAVTFAHPERALKQAAPESTYHARLRSQTYADFRIMLHRGPVLLGSWSPLMRHNSDGVQRLKEYEEAISGLVTTRRGYDWSHKQEDLFLHRQISREVDLRRFDGFVPAPDGDQRSIDAGLP